MNALELWIHSEGAKALAWTLFHFLWEGAGIAGILVLALACLKRASARARYGAACAALLGMALAFGITLVVEWPGAAPQLILQTEPPSATTAVGAVFTTAAPRPGLGLQEILPWVPALWLAGVSGLFLYRAGSWMAAERLRRMGTYAAPERWTRRLRELAASMGVGRPVTLVESCLAEVPIMLGYLKPAIVVPIGLLAGLPAEQVEAILLHELAHIRRADYPINLLQTAIEGLLFYHPAVWWVSGVVRAERENCCDDAVVAVQGNALRYASALLGVEQRRNRVPQAALAANGGSLARRIRRLLGKPDARDLSLPVLPSALLLISMAAVLVAWQPVRPQRPVTMVEPAVPEPAAVATEQVPAVQPGPPTPQPAVAPQEGAGAKPATAPNQSTTIIVPAYQLRAQRASDDEHDRRVAYADAHFALTAGDQTVPGSRTVLGETYIRYGPPDEMDAFLSDPRNLRQVWRYHYLEEFHSNAEFEFVSNGSRYRRRIVWPPPLATFTGTTGVAQDLASALNRENPVPAPLDGRVLIAPGIQKIRTSTGLELQVMLPVVTAPFRVYFAYNPTEVREYLQPPIGTNLSSFPEPNASIQIFPVKDLVTLSVPLDALSGRVDLIGDIRQRSDTGASGPTVANFRDNIEVSNGGTYESGFTVGQGSYVCRLLVRENATGRMYTEVINFEVK